MDEHKEGCATIRASAKRCPPGQPEWDSVGVYVRARSVALRVLTGCRCTQLAHAVFKSRHQFQRVQRKQKHWDAHALRIVQLQQMVDEVARQNSQFIVCVRFCYDAAAVLEGLSGGWRVHGTKIIESSAAACKQFRAQNRF